MKTTSELCCRIFVSVIKKYIYEAEFLFQARRPSATNPKLAKLLQKEGARGYGVYWLLIELLRLQTDFSLPVTETAGLVSRLGYTQKTVVVRVIENYDLFSEENGMFFSSD